MEAGHICLCAKTGLSARGQHLAWNQNRDITRLWGSSGDDEAAGYHQLGCPLFHTHTDAHSFCNFGACLVSASPVSVTPLSSLRAQQRERDSGKQDEDRNTSTAACILISAVMYTHPLRKRECVRQCCHWKRYRSHVARVLCVSTLAKHWFTQQSQPYSSLSL